MVFGALESYGLTEAQLNATNINPRLWSGLNKYNQDENSPIGNFLDASYGTKG